MKKYILHFRDGKDKYHVHTYQKSLNDAIDEGNEMSSHSYHTFIKANFLSEKRSNKKTMAKKKILYTVKYKDTRRGVKNGTVGVQEILATSIKDARISFKSFWKQEKIISVTKNVAYNNNARIKNKAMARKTYKKMVNKASSKRKNTQTGTAMSTKKYKLVMMKKSAKKPTKSGIKFTSASGDAVNKMITAFRTKCGCAIKWQLYTYRSSLKAYRLSKASR